jgi:hypothetical protein
MKSTGGTVVRKGLWVVLVVYLPICVKGSDGSMFCESDYCFGHRLSSQLSIKNATFPKLVVFTSSG